LVVTTNRISREQAPSVGTRHGHTIELADGGWPLARGVEDVQFATLGVKRDVSLMDDGCGGAVVFGLVLPHDVAGSRVEGVEVIDPEAAAAEHAAVHTAGVATGR
jgi:hypothetical protein